MYCPDHREAAPKEHQENEVLSDESYVADYFCSVCKSGLDEHQIVICDNCDNGFHANCHDPPVELEELEQDSDWFCTACK